jgi:UDP-N-acetylmuramate: L-alanyl-gamma-D-glutamyl-meso-diaminopimelate ligase
MSGLAGLAVEKGHKVTGQDKAYYPPMSLQLNKIGISENITEKVTEDLKNCDAVIIGNSLSRGNDSVEYTLQNKKKYFSGPEWIRKYILDDKIVFVVTGTHGKTTTTSMLIKIFQDNNLKPSYLLGGIYEEEKISYKYTNSKYFIIEGDEYDTSFFDKRSKFIHYKPHTLIINNIEFDHSDIFENIYEIKKQFHYLLRTMSKKTNIIFKKNDKNIEDVLAMGCWSNKKSFNKINKVKNIVGDHNLENCAAAMIAAETIGISKEASLSALEDFKGVK